MAYDISHPIHPKDIITLLKKMVARKSEIFIIGFGMSLWISEVSSIFEPKLSDPLLTEILQQVNTVGLCSKIYGNFM